MAPGGIDDEALLCCRCALPSSLQKNFGPPFTIPVHATFPYWETMILPLLGLPGSHYSIISLQLSSFKQDGKHCKREHMFVEFQQPVSRGLLTSISVHGARPNSPVYNACLHILCEMERPARVAVLLAETSPPSTTISTHGTVLPALEFRSCVKKITLLIVIKTACWHMSYSLNS